MFSVATATQWLMDAFFAEASDTMGEEKLQKIEYTLSTCDITKPDYEHGDPRHYLAAMLGARQPGSAVIETFEDDIPRFTKVIDVEENIEVANSQRAEYISNYLTNIAATISIDKTEILPIVSHLSQGLMA